MTELQLEQIKKIVYTFSSLSKINDKQLRDNLIERLSKMNIDDVMDHKKQNGHEFKVQYKGTPMSIGLFLFERNPDDEIVIKEYYHFNNNPNEKLLVNEKHLAPEYAKMIYSKQVRQHNGIPYRMQSLESIYNAKKIQDQKIDMMLML